MPQRPQRASRYTTPELLHKSRVSPPCPHQAAVTPSAVPHRIDSITRATRAESDEALLKSWLESLNSAHTRRNFETTARRFLGALGYTPLNAGARIKVCSNAGHRGANLAKRLIGETEVALLVRAAPSKRDRVLIETAYAGGLRVSEIVALTWVDVLPRDGQRVQLSIVGKGGIVRQVLLPELVSRSLLSLRGEVGVNDPVFPNSRRGGGPLTGRAVHAMVKVTAAKAGVNQAVSPHWLRHAHGAHAGHLDGGSRAAISGGPTLSP